MYRYVSGLHYPHFGMLYRPVYIYYYKNTDVFIFMVDSNDRGRISESQDELQRAMAENELRDSILLVLANKQDLPNAMSVQEITEKLGLNNLKDRLWRKCLCISCTWHDGCLEHRFISVIPSSTDIQSSCATSGDGLYDGLEWVQDTLSKREVKKTLTQPLTETAKSASGTTSKPSLLSTWVSSIGGYLQGKTVITA